MLSTQEQLKYQRQIMLAKVGEQGQLALRNAKVLVVGLGGLGNPVAMYLSAAGVGELFLADGDIVDESNLQRQILFTPNDVGSNKADIVAQRLTAQNPDVDIEIIDEMLDEETADYYCSLVDVVIDCTDNIDSRFILNKCCFNQNKTLISGAATGFDGQCFILNRQSDEPTPQSCYQCMIPSKEHAPALNCQTVGIVGPVLGIIGSIQALMCIKVIIGIKVPTHQLLVFDGLFQQWQEFKVTANKQCPVCRAS
ncbi:HesA/MoeB/ThiF family protein [Thalassotalea eurytherma]|uniref:Molybdopterin biosynthesis protein MoeB n=1 Tax=Thalassotalea eurytherma TaxID=1144278 RepID=A0ABQ6H1W7_9GAMM|nr:HesA/MoeB/ThiF family protein [Thalassotalea eurytherma]GLX81562.1 molybdopterin biosynthesis protein MoeB [Thalassotalea eurytherma]